MLGPSSVRAAGRCGGVRRGRLPRGRFRIPPASSGAAHSCSVSRRAAAYGERPQCPALTDGGQRDKPAPLGAALGSECGDLRHWVLKLLVCHRGNLGTE